MEQQKARGKIWGIQGLSNKARWAKVKGLGENIGIMGAKLKGSENKLKMYFSLI